MQVYGLPNTPRLMGKIEQIIVDLKAVALNVTGGDLDKVNNAIIELDTELKATAGGAYSSVPVRQ